jgi:hypothetical protein
MKTVAKEEQKKFDETDLERESLLLPDYKIQQHNP